jgi:electron transfer flavoprotein beta subunit
MKIVICAKEVLDPDAVDNYVLHGRLEIGADGKSLTQSAIPRLMNAYDEQAIEVALRLRDAGVTATIHTVTVGGQDPTTLLRHAAAMGADEIAAIDPGTPDLDGHAVAALLAGYVRSLGGADLVLCGRQASDDDQGVVPALLGEQLGLPVVTVARAVERTDGGVRVTRVTPDGDEIVEATCPAVVTVSNEVGTPRYPTMQRKMKARKMEPKRFKPADLGLDPAALAPRVKMVRQFVPAVQGSCEFLNGDSPAAVARQLVERLRAEKVI